MMMDTGVERMVMLCRIAEEQNDEGGRRPGQQEMYGRLMRSMFVQRLKIAMSGLDLPIDQTNRE